MEPYKNTDGLKIGDLCTDANGIGFYTYRITEIVSMNRVRLEIVKYKSNEYIYPQEIYGNIYIDRLMPLTPTKKIKSYNHPLTKIFV